jgi:hypothetical protein
MTEGPRPSEEQDSSEQRDSGYDSGSASDSSLAKRRMRVVLPDQEEPKLALRKDRPLLRFRHKNQDSRTEFDLEDVNWPIAICLFAAAIIVVAVLFWLRK